MNKAYPSINSTLMSKITVCARLRPIIPEDHRQANVVKGAPHVCVHFKKDGQSIKVLLDDLTQKIFRLDYTFDISSSQTEVFNIVVQPVVQDFLRGCNGVIIAYGPTATGKTYTLFGSDEKKGITHLAINQIFDRVQEYEESERLAKVYISFYHIYLDQIYDLLTTDQNPQPLSLREVDGKTIVENAHQLFIKDRESAFDVIIQGLQNRRFYSSNFNMRSSRSHAILQFHVDLEEEEMENHGIHDNDSAHEEKKRSSLPTSSIIRKTTSSTVEHTYHVRRSTLTIVDLAGSERLSAIKPTNKSTNKQFAMETTSINKSIAELGNCILALSKPSNNLNDTMGKSTTNQFHFHNSKLTCILGPYLSGTVASRIVIIANVNPCSYALEETLSTMKFATRAKQIRQNLKQSLQKSSSSPIAVQVEKLSHYNESELEDTLGLHQHDDISDQREVSIENNLLSAENEPTTGHSRTASNTTNDTGPSFNLREFLRACTIANRLSQTQQFLAKQEQHRQQQLQLQQEEQEREQQHTIDVDEMTLDEISLQQLAISPVAPVLKTPAATKRNISVKVGTMSPRTPIPPPPPSTFANFPSPAFTVKTLDSDDLRLLHGRSHFDFNINSTGQYIADDAHDDDYSNKNNKGDQIISPTVSVSEVLTSRGTGSEKPMLSLSIDDNDNDDHSVNLPAQLQPYLPSLRGTLAADSTPLMGEDLADVSPGLIPGLDKQLQLLTPSASGSFFFAETPRPRSQVLLPQSKTPNRQIPRLKSVDSFTIHNNPTSPSAAAAAVARLRLQRKEQEQQQQLQKEKLSFQDQSQLSMVVNESPNISAKDRYAMIRQSSHSRLTTHEEEEYNQTSNKDQRQDQADHPPDNFATISSTSLTTSIDATAFNQEATNAAEKDVTPSRRTPGMTNFTNMLTSKAAQSLLSLPPDSAKHDATSSTSVVPAWEYQSLRRAPKRRESSVQTVPPPVLHEKSIQTVSNLQPQLAPARKRFFGQLDDFDEFAPAVQVDQITQTEPIFLVSDFYGTAEEQEELTNLALLDPLEVACCFLELKKVVETQSEQIARLQALILENDS